jgi:hypothetical protein
MQATGSEARSISIATSPASVVKRVLLICISCEVALLLLDVLVARTGILGFRPMARIFDVTSESSLGNFFSSVQALGVALVLFLIRCRVRIEGPTARWRRRGWGALSLFFLYLGVDDGAMIHERVGSYASHLGGAWFHKTEAAFGSYTWQLVLGPFFALAGVLMLVFLWRELRRSDRVLVLLAITCYTVAVALDYIEGRAGAYTPLVPLLRMNIDTIQHYAQVVEELTEMFGTTLFLIGFLAHLLALTPRLHLELAAEDPR